jgi:hypothetical protein
MLVSHDLVASVAVLYRCYSLNQALQPLPGGVEVP